MDSFNFRLTYTLPTLDEIISHSSCLLDCGPYNKCNFLLFLNNFHCAENFEFVVEIDTLISKTSAADNEALMDDDYITEQDLLLRKWNLLHSTFICPSSEKEVNIPHSLREEFHASILPFTDQLVRVRQFVYELLLDSFHEFIQFTREQNQDTNVRRRTLEAVPPEAPRIVHFEPCQNLGTTRRQLGSECDYHKGLRDEWEKALEESESKLHGSLSSSRTGSETSPVGELSRKNSAAHYSSRSSSRASSRGSSIGFIVENIKDYTGWNKTRKIIQRRRSSQECSNNLNSN